MQGRIAVDRLWRTPGSRPWPGAGHSASSSAAPSRRGTAASRLPAPRRSCRPAAMRGETIDCAGRWITPGLIDCHTHLVFAGDRARRVRAAARRRELRGDRARRRRHRRRRCARRARRARTSSSRAALPRLDALIAEGVTTVEIKSRLRPRTETELRQLRAARRLGRGAPGRGRRPTFLGAHALPPEARRRQGRVHRR